MLTPLAAVLASLAAASSVPASSAPWERGPFSDPRAIAAAAAALPRPPGKHDAEVLLSDATLAFDTDGRATYTSRLVWRPFTREAAQAWARVETRWRPWHQDRPEVRARVIDAQGDVHDLDATTLSDAAVQGDDALVYSDERVVRAPLPSLDAGVVVEELIVVRDRAPMFAAGTTRRIPAAGPARRWRLRVEAPASLPLRQVVRGTSISKPAERVENGRRVLAWDAAPLPEAPPVEELAPPEDSAAPHVAVSTGASWAAVGAAYSALVEGQLAGADVRDLAQRIAGSARTREEAASRVLAYVAERLRYTGVEFGAASIVPTAPAEVVRRGFGDCKDLSLLVVALLRARGYEAHVALLRASWEGLAPELPGLGEIDHAIVHVPGRPALWLDPTAPRTPVGQIPAFDEGRLALVADGRAKALERTPESSSSDNGVAFTFTVRMQEDGRATVVANEEFSGGTARRIRAFRSSRSTEGAKELDERRAKEWLVAEALVSASWEGLAGAAPMVRSRTEARGSRLAVVDGATGTAVVRAADLFSALPDMLREIPKEESARKPRRAPVVLPEAHRAEVKYRIVPPPGYRMKSLPDAESVRFGPARYESAYSLASDGTIEAHYVFDTGARRLDAREAEALRAKVATMLALDGPRVELERTSDALLAQGRGREALAELNRLVALHPKEALHRADLADALVKLGVIDAARRSAREAVVLEPGSARAHRSLAWALEHDPLGRQTGPGADIAGAIAEMRRARDLDPREVQTRLHLAWLLAHYSSGVLFGPGAAMEEAISGVRFARGELGDRSSDDMFVSMLLHAGRAKEALPVAREAKPSASRNGGLLTATTLVEGADAAGAEAAKLDSDARSAALDVAALQLMSLRRYQDAAALLEKGAPGTSAAATVRARASLLRRVRPWEELRLDEKSPSDLFGRIMIAVVASGDPTKRIAALVPAGMRSEVERGGDASDMRGVLAAMAKTLPPGLTPVNAVDMALAHVETAVEGEAGTLHRLRANLFGTNDALTLYAIQERGVWKVAGFRDASDATLLGAEIARLAGDGQLDAARRVLEWARAQFGSPDQTLGELLATVSPASRHPVPREDLMRAAAILQAPRACRKGDGPVMRALEEAKAGADAPAWRALTLRAAECHVAACRWKEGLAAARQIRAREPAWAPAVGAELDALWGAGEYDEARTVAEARIRVAPKDLVALATLGRLAIRARDFTTAERWRRAEIEAGAEFEYNNLAWMQVFRDPVPREVLDNARRAARQSSRSRNVAHTLATVHAALGEPAEALQVLCAAVGPRGPVEPADWVVIGRVAEHYGLLDDARAAYARVPKPDAPDPLATWNLAQKWLAALAGASAAPPANPAEQRRHEASITR